MAPPKTNRKPSLGPQRNKQGDPSDAYSPEENPKGSKKTQIREISSEKGLNPEEKKQNKPSLTTSKASSGPNGRIASKDAASRLPPQNVRPLHPPKPPFSEKLVKPPKSAKSSLQPNESFQEFRGTTVNDKVIERVSELPIKQKLDPQIPKLLEKLKKLTDQCSKLSQEKTKLEGELFQMRNNHELRAEPGSWSEMRDRAIKGELLRLRSENYRLRSSVKLNDRFGELISRAALDSEVSAAKCLDAIQTAEKDEMKASAVLIEVMNHVFRLNSSLKSTETDFLKLNEEKGTKNTELWDNSFASSEVHSTENLTAKVLEVLLDQESATFSCLEGLNLKEIADQDQTKPLHDIILAASRSLLSKSIILSSFVPSKKSSAEIRKKLKAVSNLNFAEKARKIEENLKENMKNIPILDDLKGSIFLKVDLDALCSLESAETAESAISRISCLLTVLSNLIKYTKLEKMAQKLEDLSEKFLYKFDQIIASPTRELINFLDRTGFSHEVYLGYRYRLLSTLESIFENESQDGNGWILHLQSLKETSKEILETLRKKI